jgi:hypothetical protein
MYKGGLVTNYWELEPVYDVGEAPFFNFPRPLYPPDHKDGPVEDGPDVEAYKIIAWYFGRWATKDGKPEKDPGFDRAYSNNFAHGKGSNVGDSGIQGIQRQAEVAGANGVLGHRTFDILIYQRIPQGLPNAGKLPLAINKHAANLLEEAYQRFHKEPEDEAPVSGSAKEKIKAHMEKRVGYTENPANSNIDSRPDGIHKCQDVTAGAHWLDRTPWCGSWCQYALTAGGFKVDSDLCSVASIEEMAKNSQYPFRGWTTDKSKISICDLVIVGGYGVHVEMVRAKANPDGSVPTWGGNTSPGTSGSQSNGGGAYRRVRYPSEIRGFALVDF